MNDALDALAELVRDPRARSRNRHFERFREPASAHLRRLATFLVALRTEVLRLPDDGGASVEVTRGRFPRGTVRVRYRNPVLGVTRTAFLTEGEWALLLEDPSVARRLGA